MTMQNDRSPEDQARLERLLASDLIRVRAIPGLGREGIDPDSPFYDLWVKQGKR